MKTKYRITFSRVYELSEEYFKENFEEWDNISDEGKKAIIEKESNYLISEEIIYFTNDINDFFSCKIKTIETNK